MSSETINWLFLIINVVFATANAVLYHYDNRNPLNLAAAIFGTMVALFIASVLYSVV